MKDIVIVEAVRSAVGRALKGSLAQMRPDELAGQVMAGLLARVPQIKASDVEDVILVQINPIERREIPYSAREIMNRLNEITFNAALLQEFRAIDFVGRLIDAGRLDGTHYKKVRMHLVEGGAALDAYPASTKLDADFDFFLKLFEIGRKAGEKFLTENFEAIGVKGTLDLQEALT